MKENFRDQETDLVAVCSKSDLSLEGNNRRRAYISCYGESHNVFLKGLFPTVTWPNVNWTSPGVALLVSIVRLGKSSQTFLYVLAAGSLARIIS